MKKVYITDYMTDIEIEKEILNENLTTQLCDDIEVLLVFKKTINEDYLKDFKKVKYIIRYGVGYDNVDLDYINSKNITLCNTPDYGTDEVSDTAFSFLLAITRGIFRYNSFAKVINPSKSWQENTFKDLRRLNQLNLGVIGAGRIGSSLILKANQFHFRTAFYDPFVKTGHDKIINSKRYDSLDDLIINSDVISINAPLNESTNSLIDSSFIDKMKDGASLINTGRGKIIKDLDIIYDALKSNKLNSVALDVLPDEPPLDSKLLSAWRKNEPWSNGRIIINPHTAYYSLESFQEMKQKAAENALRIVNGAPPLNVINTKD